jgi:hypothetical protein
MRYVPLGVYRRQDSLGEPTDRDRIEAALSFGVDAAGISLSEKSWDELCQGVSKEFYRLSREPRCSRALTED